QQMQSQGLPAISIPPFVGKLLTLLAKLVNAKHILEIGTLGGYSTIWLARPLPEDGRLISLEIDPKNAAVAKDNLQRAGLTDKVEIRLGDALQTINTLSGPFDLIFLDADKPRYPLYLE